jgi:hypothetical protein
MPLNIGDSNSSRGLMKYEKFDNKQTTLKTDTRVDQTAMEWLIAVTGGITYCIRFSGNFHKKHLYTSTKKLANVQVEYDKLGAIADEDARWKAAQEAADEKKFHKQLGHRSRAEQDCSCGHSIGDHAGATGPCNKVTQKLEFPTGYKVGDKVGGKPVKKGFVNYPCGCTAFSNTYDQKRTLQGKPSINPLLGATTSGANDVIWMDKIPRAHFEKVVVDAIQKRFLDLKGAGKSWGDGDASGDKAEHVEWDFGASHRGAILKIAQNTTVADAKLKNYSCVEVLMKLDNTDASRPVFTACHLDGKKTK